MGINYILFALDIACAAAQFTILIYLKYTPVVSFWRHLAENPIAVSIVRKISPFRLLA